VLSRPGETLQLTAVALGHDGQPVPASFSWMSDTPSVATVDQNGLVTAMGYGGASVYATTSQPGNNGARGSAPIMVGQSVSEVTIAPASASIAKGSTLQFSASAKDASGNPIPNAAFRWDTLDHTIVTVDRTSGLATAVSPGGPIRVYATIVAIQAMMGSAQLTVTPAAP
jgi:uncharacterized protein YjdB